MKNKWKKKKNWKNYILDGLKLAFDYILKHQSLLLNRIFYSFILIQGKKEDIDHLIELMEIVTDFIFDHKNFKFSNYRIAKRREEKFLKEMKSKLDELLKQKNQNTIPTIKNKI